MNGIVAIGVGGKPMKPEYCTMGFFKRQWERFKSKSAWGKFSDLFFVALLITLLIPDGRIFFQRLILQSGLFGAFIENENQPVSEENWSFKITDLDGNVYELVDFKGKKILLNFWATWCPPCLAEIPGLIDLVDACPNENNVFLLVTREPASKVKSFLEKKGWDIPVYLSTSVPGDELDYSSLPTTFIIDETGTIIHHSSGARRWNDEESMAYFCEP